MGTVYGLLLSFGILFIHHFLSRRDNLIWGAILPVGYAGLMIWLFFITKAEFEPFLLVGLFIFLGIWSEGRISVKKKRQKELDKITLQDL